MVGNGGRLRINADDHFSCQTNQFKVPSICMHGIVQSNIGHLAFLSEHDTSEPRQHSETLRYQLR
jgi:hypothetical protein